MKMSFNVNPVSARLKRKLENGYETEASGRFRVENRRTGCAPMREWKARGINWIARLSDCDAIANFSRKMLAEKD